MSRLQKIKEKLFPLRKHLYAFSSVVLFVTLSHLFNYSVSDSKEDNAYQEYFNNHYKILGLNLPVNLNFCGEKVPVKDFSVREALDRELLVNTYWQSQTLLFHKRANRWLPVIEPILKKHDIPDDFKYLAVVESGLTNTISPAKATGYWQLIESSAKMYGLEINDEVDERYNVIKSTEAACKYFRESYSKFNNWTLVAASYNMGIGGIENQLKKQKTDNYYDLLLNEETGRYLFRILAVKEILSHPKAYGFLLRKKDLYPFIPTYEIAVDSSITDLADFALSQGVNYKTLKTFNPWLRKNTLTNADKKKYLILLPKKEFLKYYFEEDASIEDAEGLIDSDTAKYFSINEVADSTNRIIHIVTPGETPSSIAKKYNVDEQQIKLWNLISDTDILKAKQEIILFVDHKNK